MKKLPINKPAFKSALGVSIAVAAANSFAVSQLQMDVTDAVDTITDVIQYLSLVGASYITVLAAMKAWKLARGFFA